ncbi:DUF2000 domain-containing protein [Photobacterium halotolerans]|uniref:DUF2000 domain-containing protein n=1 Tax=Photobacterium halotolerans TaxID=265726 RepID=UPI00040D7687|nr:DUF2000 domain-containing protein [Photobacterium halotolerans]
MEFDASKHKCTIVVDNDLPTGLAVNAASVIGISFGKNIQNLVGPDMKSMNDFSYPGVIYSPLPILKARGDYLHELHQIGEMDDDIYVMPFSSLAQSCKTYDEYGERISSVNSENIELVAIGLIGPRKKIQKLTGNLSLFT